MECNLGERLTSDRGHLTPPHASERSLATYVSEKSKKIAHSLQSNANNYTEYSLLLTQPPW